MQSSVVEVPEATPVHDALLGSDRWLEVATFPWEVPEWVPWDLYQPSLRELVVELSGRDDYTTFTTEHVAELAAMLEKDPDDVASSAGSDAD